MTICDQVSHSVPEWNLATKILTDHELLFGRFDIEPATMVRVPPVRENTSAYMRNRMESRRKRAMRCMNVQEAVDLLEGMCCPSVFQIVAKVY